MYRQTAQILKAASSFSIIAHTSPDADTLGSCFALKTALEKLGKGVTLYTDCIIPEYLSFLDGEYTVYESGTTYPAADVCLCVDCGDLGRVGEREALLQAAATTINIDHHPTNTKFAQVNLVNPSAAATAEMIYELICELGLELDSCIAKYLYTAIVGDTGCFRYSNTTSHTFRIAAQLLETGIEGWRICSALFDSNPESVVRLRCKAVSEAELLADGRIGIALVTAELLNEFGLNAEDVEGIVETIRSIKGIEVAIFIKQGKDKLKVSMRSAQYVDVAALAAQFGGGGHKRAAGFSADGDILELKKTIGAAAIKALAEINH